VVEDWVECDVLSKIPPAAAPIMTTATMTNSSEDVRFVVLGEPPAEVKLFCLHSGARGATGPDGSSCCASVRRLAISRTPLRGFPCLARFK